MFAVAYSVDIVELSDKKGHLVGCVLCRWCTDGDSKTEGVYNSHGIKQLK